MKYTILIAGLILVCSSCNRNKFDHDASGTFEATEIIISAEATGKIEQFDVTEGDMLTKGQYLGYVDTTQLYLRKLQLQATSKAVNVRRLDVSIQVAIIKEQISKAETEKRRIGNLLKDGAATQKQLDDVDSQLAVLQRSLAAQLNSLSTSVNSLNEESSAYEIQVAQIEDQLAKSRIINPIDGVVLSKYAEAKEMTSQGRPLYKLADTRNMFLRAYTVSTQLESIRTGQEVTVFINAADDTQKSYKGIVSWISGKAEFTPKTIQTQDERQNLVYAVKIAVENTDGLIKTGMYGDVDFNNDKE
ncbi:MAG: HlyD family efflux transporter periplasmic adaptor subunit [Prevotella sp.]|jgi:HlyD family secretion protein|nr:HlyD family efflux transporter periplasmic adaptor subunit [Prevotella sp.]